MVKDKHNFLCHKKRYPKPGFHFTGSQLQYSMFKGNTILCSHMQLHCRHLPDIFIRNRYPKEGSIPRLPRSRHPHAERKHQAYTTWKFYRDYIVFYVCDGDPFEGRIGSVFFCMIEWPGKNECSLTKYNIWPSCSLGLTVTRSEGRFSIVSATYCSNGIRKNYLASYQ